MKIGKLTIRLTDSCKKVSKAIVGCEPYPEWSSYYSFCKRILKKKIAKVNNCSLFFSFFIYFLSICLKNPMLFSFIRFVWTSYPFPIHKQEISTMTTTNCVGFCDSESKLFQKPRRAYRPPVRSTTYTSAPFLQMPTSGKFALMPRFPPRTLPDHARRDRHNLNVKRMRKRRDNAKKYITKYISKSLTNYYLVCLWWLNNVAPLLLESSQMQMLMQTVSSNYKTNMLRCQFMTKKKKKTLDVKLLAIFSEYVGYC